MAFTLDDVRADVNMELQDDKPFFQADEVDLAIQLALRRVNRDKPLRDVVEVSGDGTQDYAVPTNYVKGFSQIKDIEFPSGEIPPLFIEQDDSWREYEDPTATPRSRILFLDRTPTATEKFRVTYTRPHSLTNVSTTSTVEDQDTFQAIVYKSLSNIFRAKGSKFLESNDPVIGSDTVDFGAKGQSFLFLAGEWNAEYKSVVGLVPGETVADDAFAEKDVVFGFGEAALFHPRSQR